TRSMRPRNLIPRRSISRSIGTARAFAIQPSKAALAMTGTPQRNAGGEDGPRRHPRYAALSSSSPKGMLSPKGSSLGNGRVLAFAQAALVRQALVFLPAGRAA